MGAQSNGDTINRWFMDQKYNPLLQSLSLPIRTIISSTNLSSTITNSNENNEYWEMFRNFMSDYHLYPAAANVGKATYWIEFANDTIEKLFISNKTNK